MVVIPDAELKNLMKQILQQNDQILWLPYSCKLKKQFALE